MSRKLLEFVSKLVFLDLVVRLGGTPLGNWSKVLTCKEVFWGSVSGDETFFGFSIFDGEPLRGRTI